MPSRLYGAAAEFIEAKYHGAFHEVCDVVSVGTSFTQIIKPDPERIILLAVNLSVNTVYVGFDNQVSASRGIILSPNGGSYQVDIETDTMLPTRPLFGLSTGASSNVYTLFVRRDHKFPTEVT
jgi:hypothetical protein